MGVIRRRYSRDLRQRVVHQRYKLRTKPPEIAVNLDMSLRVVERVLKLWREIGDVERHPSRSGIGCKLSRLQIEVWWLLLTKESDNCSILSVLWSASPMSISMRFGTSSQSSSALTSIYRLYGER